jgi:hypothetical protein
MVLSGCATPMGFQRSISPEETARLKATKIINVVAQDELEPVFARNDSETRVASHIIGPLAAVLIGNSVAKSGLAEATQRIQPLREVVKDIDFRKLLRTQLFSTLAAADWLKMSGFTDRTKDISIDKLRSDLANGPEDAALTVYTTYHLSPKLTTLVVHSVVKLWVNGQDNPVYIGNFEYQSMPVTTEEGADSAVGKWTAANQAAYRFAVSQGIRELTAMIHYELVDRHGVADLGGETVRLPYTAWDSRGRIELDGKLVRQAGSRYWMRAPNNVLVSLTKGGFLMGSMGRASGSGLAPSHQGL